MFGFLKKKKKYAIDFSAIKVDIHSHLIPGVDDGAKDLDNSIELIRGLIDLGFKKIITTPHVYIDYYPNSSDRLLAGLDTLKQGLSDRNIDIEVECAAEYFLDDHFEDLLKKGDILSFGDNHVLIEMSFFSPPIKLDQYLFKMQTKKYKPILAHPERYLYMNESFEKFEELKSKGCKLQLNLLSLTGHYGKEVKMLAEKMLKHKLYDYVGTDTHHLTHIEKLKKLLLNKNNKLLAYEFSNSEFL